MIYFSGGEAGIRTQEGLLTPTHFPGVLLRPARTPLRKSDLKPPKKQSGRDRSVGPSNHEPKRTYYRQFQGKRKQFLSSIRYEEISSNYIFS